MKTAIATFAAAAVLVLSSGMASATGCLKGAAVGGAAGHVAGKHGKAGAAAGCVVGHHKASKGAKQANQATAAAQPNAAPAPANSQ